MNFIAQYVRESVAILESLDQRQILKMIEVLSNLRQTGGRLFLLGVGGSAANCSHAVNDFRKLTGIEAYAPTDNVSELTARTNDEGWSTVFSAWLEVSRISHRDVLFVLSVGGGSLDKNISPNLVTALQYGRRSVRASSASSVATAATQHVSPTHVW